MTRDEVRDNGGKAALAGMAREDLPKEVTFVLRLKDVSAAHPGMPTFCSMFSL